MDNESSQSGDSVETNQQSDKLVTEDIRHEFNNSSITTQSVDTIKSIEDQPLPSPLPHSVPHTVIDTAKPVNIDVSPSSSSSPPPQASSPLSSSSSSPSSSSSSSTFPDFTTVEPNTDQSSDPHAHVPTSTNIFNLTSLPVDDVTTDKRSATIEMLTTTSSSSLPSTSSPSDPPLLSSKSDQHVMTPSTDHHIVISSSAAASSPSSSSSSSTSPSSSPLTDFIVHLGRGDPPATTAHPITMETTPVDDVTDPSVTSADPRASHQTTEALHDVDNSTTDGESVHILPQNLEDGTNEDSISSNITTSVPNITTAAPSITTNAITPTMITEANYITIITEENTPSQTQVSIHTTTAQSPTPSSTTHLPTMGNTTHLLSTMGNTTHLLSTRGNTTHLLSTRGNTTPKPPPYTTQDSPMVTQTYEITCNNTSEGDVAKWLGFPIFWWVVVLAVFAVVLIMIISTCLCLIASKRKWRKKNKQRRGYLDDQLTSSFIQSYSNPEVTPSGRNNKTNKLPPKPKKGHHHPPKHNYPKSYHLGPKLLPFPADAVRLKPSASTPNSPLNSDNFKAPLVNGRGANDVCLSDKVQPKNRDETTFGTWRKSGVAGFGGFAVPGYKKVGGSNLNDGDGGSDKKSRKSNQDDEVFEENPTPKDPPRDPGLTTFIYNNRINNNNSNPGSISTFKSCL